MVCTTPCIQDRWTPLMRASFAGERECLELLLSWNANIDHQSKVTRDEGWGVAPMVVGADACIVGVYDYGAGVVVWIFGFG